MKGFTQVEPTLSRGTAVTPGASPVLVCPGCGHDYLHQGRPQGGDDSLVVPFKCEGCTNLLALEMGQYKGHAFVRWWVGPEVPDRLRHLFGWDQD